MKVAAIALVVLGLLMTLYTGFTIVTQEKVVDLGKIELTSDDSHTFTWQPYVGVGVMLLGVLLLVTGRTRRLSV